MLSAAKVRQHGMQDDRWLVKDKIAQHRYLIDIYERDKKIQDTDLARAKERYSRDIRKLRKDIMDKRGDLETAVGGDKQFVRTVLQEHRRLQIAHKNSTADKVLECIQQENFNKRKKLDLITYDKKKKMTKFKILQEEAAEMRDRLLYEGKERLPSEKREQTIANYVQCANVKKNAALAITGMYTKILDILKKDASYFSSVLEALKSDCHAQGKCLIGAAEMGQLAMEYLDDRKYQFEQLEHEIKKNMKEREKTLKMVKKEVKDLTKSFPRLIHKDEQPNLTDLYDEISDAGSLHSIHAELNEVTSSCKRLQRATLVPSFQDILPRLKDQDFQYQRLLRQLKMSNDKMNMLFEDRKHAQIILEQLRNSGQEETAQYIEKKKKYIEQAKNEKLEQMHTQILLDEKARLIMSTRESMLQLAFLLSSVRAVRRKRVPKDEEGEEDLYKKPKKVKVPRKDSRKDVQADTESREGPGTTVPDFEPNIEKIVDIIYPKIELLLSNLRPSEITDSMRAHAHELYHSVLTQIMISNYTPEGEAETTLIEFEMEDASVPSYKTVKKVSKYICDSQVSEFDAAPDPRKK